MNDIVNLKCLVLHETPYFLPLAKNLPANFIETIANREPQDNNPFPLQPPHVYLHPNQ